jgi:hypothetical protein
MSQFPTKKEIIEKAKANLVEYLGNRIETGEVLLEEFKPVAKDAWEITFSFFEKIKEGEKNFAYDTLVDSMSMKNNFKKRYKIICMDANGNFQGMKNYE